MSEKIKTWQFQPFHQKSKVYAQNSIPENPDANSALQTRNGEKTLAELNVSRLTVDQAGFETDFFRTFWISKVDEKLH